MTTSSPTAHRRALAGLGIVAGSMLLLAPVAGAERPNATAGPAAQSSDDSGAERDARTPVAAQESAAPGEPSGASGRHQQPICHRTRSAGDPYVQVTVEFRTEDGEVVGDHEGHATHDGPVFDPATMEDGEVWGDIIPPFTTSDGVVYEGRNWPDGQAIFDNGCRPPASTPERPAGTETDRSSGGPTESPRDAPRSDVGDNRDGTVDQHDAAGPEDSREEADAETDDVASAPTAASGAPQAGEQVRRAGGATGDIAAVLGNRVARDDDRGEVVPASDRSPALVAALARADAGVAARLMLALALLTAGYVAVDALRNRGGSSA